MVRGDKSKNDDDNSRFIVDFQENIAFSVIYFESVNRKIKLNPTWTRGHLQASLMVRARN